MLADGEEACLLYKQLCPDILILDLRMPKKAGIEIVIEPVPQKPGPGIIVLTHSAKEEDLRRAHSPQERKASRHAAPDTRKRIPTTFAVWRSHLHRAGSSIF